MVLETKLGTQISATIDGHSASNGAIIPGGSTIHVTSNDETVATLAVADYTVPEAGGTTFTTAVAVLAEGSTDIHAVVTTPDGTIYEDTSTLVVGPAAAPGLIRVSVTLTEVFATPK